MLIYQPIPSQPEDLPPWLDYVMPQIELLLSLYTGTTYPETMTVNVGTLSAGTVDTVKEKDGTFVTVTEIVTTGMEVQFDFSCQFLPKRLTWFGRYEGSAAHTVQWEIYDWDASAWDYLGSTAHRTTNQWESYSFGGNYLSGKALRVRFRHVSTGVAGHTFNVDWLGVGI